MTLSNKALTLNGTSAEDRALQWLVYNDSISIMPNSEANKTRLRQRFALLTFGFQETFPPIVVLTSYGWQVSAVSECDWYSGFQCKNEQVTKIQVRSMRGTIPPDLSWLTAMTTFTVSSGAIAGTFPSLLGWWANITTFSVVGALKGTIPSSIGAWKAVKYFSVASNQLSGTIPSTVAAWTALDRANFESNNLIGTMPTFGAGFCPSNGNGFRLSADCREVSCDCCNGCF
jgi:hypothetical protein